jgi:hypothetical protein
VNSTLATPDVQQESNLKNSKVTKPEKFQSTDYTESTGCGHWGTIELARVRSSLTPKIPSVF